MEIYKFCSSNLSVPGVREEAVSLNLSFKKYNKAGASHVVLEVH